MKVILYLEFYRFLQGRLFKNIGTGLLSSYRNQRAMLTYLNIPFTEAWDDTGTVLQINTPWLKSLYLIHKAKRRHMNVIIFAHVTMEDAMQVFRFMPIVAPLFKRYLTYVYDAATVICAPTSYTKSLLMNYGIAEKKIVVLSNGVQLNTFYRDDEKRKRFRRDHNLEGIVVGTVGLVIPRKGIDTFLSLAQQFSHNRFVWFGKKYNSLLVKPLPRVMPTNVEFTGYVDDILGAMNALDIFIFPSYEENQGMVILEAAAVGLPILVRDIPVYRGWLVHGKNCLKAENDEAFRLLLDQLIRDEKLRTRLSANAKLLAADEDIRTVAKNLVRLYRKIMV